MNIHTILKRREKNPMYIYKLWNHCIDWSQKGNGLLSSMSNTSQQKGKVTTEIQMWIWLTNMNDVSLFVQHDVAIMPVFNLEQKQEQTICSHTADEIIASLYKQEDKTNQKNTENLITLHPRSRYSWTKLSSFFPFMISLKQCSMIFSIYLQLQ